MVYRVYPYLLFAVCFASLLGGVSLVSALTESAWFFLLPPLPAAFIGYLIVVAVTSVFPRIRFVNESEIEGLGYVHQPLGPMLLVAAIGLAVALLKLVR